MSAKSWSTLNTDKSDDRGVYVWFWVWFWEWVLEKNALE